MRTRHVLAVALALALAPILTLTAQAGTLDDIKKRGKIVIGVKADYPPYGFTDVTGQIAGLEIDLARYIALKLTGSENRLELVPVVGANRIEFLRQGRIDLILATMSESPERGQVVDFSLPYYSSGSLLLTRKDSGIKSWDDVRGKHKVCSIQGAFYNKAFMEMGLNLMNFPGTAAIFKALQDGHCQAFATDDSFIISSGKLQDPAWTDFHLVGKPILAAPWGMGIRKGDTEFKRAIDAIVVEWHRSGYILVSEGKWRIPSSEWAMEARAKALK